ncbi:MAG: heparinase II/III family protein [Clostridia bacterium]|nr:heparinase II/III family protein [Clostridia bacterium]
MKNDIIADVLRHSGKGVHPRIMLTEADFRRIAARNDVICDAGYKNVVAFADRLLCEKPREYNIPDGIRLLSVCRTMVERVTALGMAYRLTGEKKYAEKCYVELENAANFKDWNPYHFLDEGEMCNAFGIGYDWIYDYMTEEQRSKIRRAIVEKGLMQFREDYLDLPRRRSYKWYQDDPGDNWKLVCNGGLTVAALAICDEEDVDREFLSEVFERSFSDAYTAVRNMYLPDGSYAEGFTYWEYATTYLSYYTSALRSATGTDYGLTDYEPVKKSAYYVRSMCSNDFICFDFGDSYTAFLCSPVYLWIGANFGVDDISAIRSEYLRANPKRIEPMDLIWYRAEKSATLKPLPLDYGTVGGSNASFRSGWGTDDLYCAVHYGENDAYHAHADTGSFIIEYGGKRFMSELGMDNYNVPRYRNTYRFRAEGHNTVVINPSEEKDQCWTSHCYVDAYRAADTEKGIDGIAVCDMSEAYFGKGVKRGIKMTADRNAVVVQDELELESTDIGYWFAHTKAEIALSEDAKSAVLTIDGVKMLVKIVSGGVFEVMAADYLFPAIRQPDARDNSEYRKLSIRFSGSTTVCVAFIPLRNGSSHSENSIPLIPISNW